jgi:hypothetical protein
LNKAIGYLSEMTSGLHDGHFTISITNASGSVKGYRSPQKTRVSARKPLSTAFYFRSAEVSMVKNSLASTDYEMPKSAEWIALTGKIKNPEISNLSTSDYVAYLGFEGFSFYSDKYRTERETLLKTFFNNITSPNCKGVIFDVRGNNGGSVADVTMLLSPLITSDLVYGLERGKNSAARYDYLPWQETRVYMPIGDTNSMGTPTRMANAGKVPIVILVNDWSISCAEAFTMGIRTLPKGYVIGTQTFGAFGGRMDGENNDYPNSFYTRSGSFTVEHGNSGGADYLKFTIIEAGSQMAWPDKTCPEGTGIIPDQIIDYNYGTSPLPSVDPQIKAACDYINSKL